MRPRTLSQSMAIKSNRAPLMTFGRSLFWSVRRPPTANGWLPTAVTQPITEEHRYARDSSSYSSKSVIYSLSRTNDADNVTDLYFCWKRMQRRRSKVMLRWCAVCLAEGITNILLQFCGLQILRYVPLSQWLLFSKWNWPIASIPLQWILQY